MAAVADILAERGGGVVKIAGLEVGINRHAGEGEQALIGQVDGELAVGPARVVEAVIQEAVGVLPPGVEEVADPVDLAGDIGLVDRHLVLSIVSSQRAGRFGAGSRGPGDDIDHPALRRAPDRRARALDDLDPLDDPQGDMGEIGRPGHGRVEADAVDEHQYMLLPAALDENPGDAVEISRSFIHREPGHPVKDLGQVLGVDVLNLLSADDGDILGHLSEGFIGAGGHFHHL